MSAFSFAEVARPDAADSGHGMWPVYSGFIIFLLSLVCCGELPSWGLHLGLGEHR